MARRERAAAEGAVTVLVKVVPGAKRDEICGMLGERLKVRVSAPPEDGKANQAVCRLLASELGIKPRQVEIVSGHSRSEKTVRIAGVDGNAVGERLRVLGLG